MTLWLFLCGLSVDCYVQLKIFDLAQKRGAQVSKFALPLPTGLCINIAYQLLYLAFAFKTLLLDYTVCLAVQLILTPASS